MAQPPIAKVTPARRVAVWLLTGVTRDGETLAELTAKDSYQALVPADRARALRLATETLRYAGRADKLLKKHISKAPPDQVQNTLRLGVVEVAGLGAPIHAVTDDLVTLIGAASRTRPYKGLVNAVLRKAVADADGKWDKSPVPTLPKWLRRPLMDAYTNPKVMQMEVAHMKGAPLDLTVKSDPDGWANTLGGVALPNGTVRLNGGQVSALEGFSDGDWWVQDAAARVAVDWLRPSAGETALDLCAAPGGKTMQLAAAGAKVTAIDLSDRRLDRVRENLTRTQLSADVQVGDVLKLPAGEYDAVLLDAPCSATGTIRRHPDLPFAKQGDGISELIALQSKMLAAAAKQVKPGGRIVFCTCSLIPDEGEVQAEEFLAAHPQFVADPTIPTGMDPDWRTPEGGLRLRPDYWAELGGMDGFYIIRLNRAEV